jgi:hypothetical protein
MYVASHTKAFSFPMGHRLDGLRYLSAWRDKDKRSPYTAESRCGLTVSANERIQIAHCNLPCTALRSIGSLNLDL